VEAKKSRRTVAEHKDANATSVTTHTHWSWRINEYSNDVRQQASKPIVQVRVVKVLAT